MKGALRDEFVKFAGTVLTVLQRFIRKLLPNLFNPAAFCALIFVNGHLRTSLYHNL
jgi:hypothetical protein